MRTSALPPPTPFGIGVISDTHDYFDPQVPGHFAGVNHILHAGDIGQPGIITELEKIAPVTVVLGNNDLGLPYRETEVIELGGSVFLIHHIVNPRELPEALRRRIEGAQPAVVVFGHTHQAWRETIGGILYLNPGYSGRPKAGRDRSVAVLTCTGSEVLARFLPL